MLFFWVNFCVWYEIRVKALFLLLLKWSEVNSVSRIRLFATPWTVAGQAPLSMGFSRQEYWSGLPFPSPGDLPNPGTEPGLQHGRQMLYPLSHRGILLLLLLKYSIFSCSSTVFPKTSLSSLNYLCTCVRKAIATHGSISGFPVLCHWLICILNTIC